MKDYSFGNYIYSLREKEKMTQNELADILGVSDKAISKWENGSAYPNTKIIRKLANVFNISIDELLSIKDNTKEKKIVKIVLTGGPCAGKSTAMNWIQNFFSKKGYGVLFVPETATDLISSGLAPWLCENSLDYQNCQFKMQLEKEKIYMEGAKYLKEDKILVVCDRGLLDNKAYMTNREFNFLLRNLNLNVVEARDSYDAVFHLVTAANGAEEYYNLDNQARTETIEEARALDTKTINAWTGHPHLRIINNNCDFENKMKKLLTEISHFLGEPEPYEIERKYLIEYPDISYLENLDNCEKVSIVQTYLKSEPNEEIRIRQRGSNGHYIYSKTRKINISGIKRVEIESRLTEEEYISELVNTDTTKSPIVKTRYCLNYNNQYFEIDVYPFWNDKAILEIELDDENDEVIIPEFIKVIEEVTDNKKYKNASLALIKK